MFFTVFGRFFDVLSGIWCEFDVMCFLLQGGARLLGHALLLGHIRYLSFFMNKHESVNKISINDLYRNGTTMY